jgi:hypothetical protein
MMLFDEPGGGADRPAPTDMSDHSCRAKPPAEDWDWLNVLYERLAVDGMEMGNVLEALKGKVDRDDSKAGGRANRRQ